MSLPMVPLDQLCEINVGRTPSRDRKDYWDSPDHPWVSIADMSRGRSLNSTKEAFSEKARRECNMKLVPTGTVLFSFKLSIGKVSIAAQDLFTNEAIAALPVLDPQRLDVEYLARALEFLNFSDAGNRAVMGQTLNKAGLKQIRIPLPPLPEQRRIAAILDQADALRRLRRQSLSRLSDLGQVIFLEMFGDPKVNRRSFARLSFEQSCSDKTAAYDKIKSGEYKSEGEIAIVDQGKSLIAGWVSGAKNPCRRETPVIVFGDHTRVIKLIDFPFVVGADGAKVLVPTGRFDAVFFSELLKLMPLPDLGYSRHMRELKRMTFICPPLDEQISFATRLSKLRRLRNEHSRHATDLDRLFSSLQHRAFRGEL